MDNGDITAFYDGALDTKPDSDKTTNIMLLCIVDRGDNNSLCGDHPASKLEGNAYNTWLSSDASVSKPDGDLSSPIGGVLLDPNGDSVPSGGNVDKHMAAFTTLVCQRFGRREMVIRQIATDIIERIEGLSSM